MPVSCASTCVCMQTVNFFSHSPVVRTVGEHRSTPCRKGDDLIPANSLHLSGTDRWRTVHWNTFFRFLSFLHSLPLIIFPYILPSLPPPYFPFLSHIFTAPPCTILLYSCCLSFPPPVFLYLSSMFAFPILTFNLLTVKMRPLAHEHYLKCIRYH